MGQALLLAGAFGIGAAGASYAFRTKEVRIAPEPRHAPGFFEAERACEEHLSQDPLTAREPDDADEVAEALAAAGGAPVSASTAPAAPAFAGAAVAAAQQQQGALSEEEVERQRKQAERSRIVHELRALRVQAERRRTDFVLQERRALREQAWSDARQCFPRPAWLEIKDCINVAVTGNAGVGKSSFINTVRNLRPRDSGAADVSPNETTMEPKAYDFSNLAVDTRLWDLPGAGTRRFPRDEYVQSMGLRYFDIVIILTASRYTETEIMIGEELRKFHVPYFMVRNKVDADITNNEEDHGISPDETLSSIRDDMLAQGVSDPHLISSKFTNRERFDLQNLMADACRAITVARDIPEDWLGLSALTSQVPTVTSAEAGVKAAQPSPPPPMPAVRAGPGAVLASQHAALDAKGGYVV